MLTGCQIKLSRMLLFPRKLDVYWSPEVNAVVVQLDALGLGHEELNNFVFRVPEEHLHELQLGTCRQTIFETNAYMFPLDSLVIGIY